MGHTQPAIDQPGQVERCGRGLADGLTERGSLTTRLEESWLEAEWEQLWRHPLFSLRPRLERATAAAAVSRIARVAGRRGPRLAFFGLASDWSCAFLYALLRAGHDVRLIVTSARDPEIGAGPDRFSLIESCYGIPRLAVARVNTSATLERLAACEVELIVVASFDQILKPRLFTLPRYGAINVHPAPLPRYRGPEPIFWMVMNAEAEGGVTVHQIDAGIDTGPILAQRRFPIRPQDAAGAVARRSAEVGVPALLAVIEAIEQGWARPRPQPASPAVYAGPVEGNAIDWALPADRIARRIQAGTPDHPLHICLGGQCLVILDAQVITPPPGLGDVPGSFVQTPRGLVARVGGGTCLCLRLADTAPPPKLRENRPEPEAGGGEASYREHEQTAAEQIPSVRCAVLTVSDTRTESTDASGAIILDALALASHRVVERQIVPDEPTVLGPLLERLCADEQVQAVLLNGGTGIAPRDQTYEVVATRLEKRLDGFGELFRMLSWEEIGAAAMLSRAIGGVRNGRIVLAMPGSRSAVTLAMNKLVIPQLGLLVWEATKETTAATRR